MSRFIQILDGDYGAQTAEFTLIGLQQKPALALRVPETYRNWRRRIKTRMAKVVWPIEEKVARVEKIDEGNWQPGSIEWNFDTIERESLSRSFGKFTDKFSPPTDTGPMRNVKKIHFRLWFKDGTQLTAIADARVFQNLHAVVE